MNRGLLFGDVRPHVGVGPVLLGMTKEEVLEAIGAPTNRRREKYGSYWTEHWEYEDVGLELDFCDDHDWRLTKLTVSDPRFTLEGERLIGLGERRFVERVEKGELPGFVPDDSFPSLNAADYAHDALGLSVWFSEGVIENITLFAKYETDRDTPIWPKRARR